MLLNYKSYSFKNDTHKIVSRISATNVIKLHSRWKFYCCLEKAYSMLNSSQLLSISLNIRTIVNICCHQLHSPHKIYFHNAILLLLYCLCQTRTTNNGESLFYYLSYYTISSGFTSDVLSDTPCLNILVSTYSIEQWLWSS